MGKKITSFIFFGNYFIGIIAVALSLETVFQLRIPANSAAYYLLLFAVTIMYYTYAYAGAKSTAINPRTSWYVAHRKFIQKSQLAMLAACIALGLFLFVKNYQRIIQLPFSYFILLTIIPLATLLYYGLMPKSFYKINLRNTGWLKAFVIGFVWGCCVSLLPVIMLHIEQGTFFTDPILMVWLFIKNWMFCTVNSIIFDVKDYADDSNKQLKTFVVKFGLRKTIFLVLIPLLLVGVSSFLCFAFYRHFTFLSVLCNFLPFLLLLIVAYSMQRRKKILYYLIVIDGILLFKAICGIIGMQFLHNQLN